MARETSSPPYLLVRGRVLVIVLLYSTLSSYLWDVTAALTNYKHNPYRRTRARL